jgi:hypothetical protein
MSTISDHQLIDPVVLSMLCLGIVDRVAFDMYKLCINYLNVQYHSCENSAANSWFPPEARSESLKTFAPLGDCFHRIRLR